MILRKPYAFFIKHFKLFNAILAILEVFIIYKLSFLFKFLNEYSSYPQGAIGQDLTGTLLTKNIFIVLIGIIIFSGLLMGILSLKKKPTKLYLLSFIGNIILLVFLFVSNNFLEQMERQIIDTRTVFALRDVSLIALIIELFFVIVTLIRTIGLDLRKFEFGHDLQELNITAEDNEEFEINFEMDSSEFKRKFKEIRRNFKYFVKENKLIIIITGTFLFALISYFIYSNSYYRNLIRVDSFIQADDFYMGVSKSYITDKNYQNNIFLEQEKLVVVPIKVKTNGTKKKLKLVSFSLNINDNRFYTTNAYKNQIIDLGTTYDETAIGTEFENYILVFKIPTSLSNKKMFLEYNNENNKKIKFEIKKEDIETSKEKEEYVLGDTITFNNSLIKNGLLTINNYEISNEFQLNYKFCINTNECYNSYEYIIPNYKNTNDKVLLKINGNIELNDSSINITNLSDFITKYGTIIYTLEDETTKIQNIAITSVTPQKVKYNDTYFLEILDEIKYAKHISLQFTIRNNVYIYNLY